MVERVVASMTTLVYPVATRIASFILENWRFGCGLQLFGSVGKFL